MLNGNLHSSSRLVLPSYKSLKHHEGRGNYAIARYYQFPFSYFYRAKLKLILKLMGSQHFKNLLDFGSGPGIFTKSLKQHSNSVVSFDKHTLIDPRWRFDAIVCASVLEFSPIITTLFSLASIIDKKGQLFVASPMTNSFTKAYFKAIKDKNARHSHETIITAVSKFFTIEEIITWKSLYFALRARPLTAKK